jgi:hypothetical protein
MGIRHRWRHWPNSRSHSPHHSGQQANSPHVPSDAQIKHLEFIQSVITRLATNSFLAKGWALTVAGALYGFSVNHLNPWIALVGLVPVVAFWWLDAYFLRTERLFRCLYDDARKLNTSVELFSMNVALYRDDIYSSWRNVILSRTLRVFYGVLSAVGLIIFIASIIHSYRPAHAARTFIVTSQSMPHERPRRCRSTTLPAKVSAVAIYYLYDRYTNAEPSECVGDRQFDWQPRPQS